MLNNIRNLINDFQNKNINYCHWKSNVNIVEACEGIGDLDLLFEREQYEVVTNILLANSFKKLESHIDRQFPGVEDFIGLDPQSGQLVHLQAHYALTTGQPMVKNYHLSIENIVLASSIKCNKTGVLIPAPELELIIHVFRTFIKMGLSKFIRPNLLKKMMRKSKEELEYLLSSVDSISIENMFKASFPNLDYHLFLEAMNTLLKSSSLIRTLKVRTIILGQLKIFERRSYSSTQFTWLIRRGYLLYSQKIKKRTPKRMLAAGGYGIAIIGSDGAGKSTAIRKLNNWLGEYLEVSNFHMGKPKKSLQTVILAYMVALVKRFDSKLTLPRPEIENYKKWPNWLAWLPCYLYISLAKDRYKNYINAKKHISMGNVAIFDRYPMDHLDLMEVPQISLISDTSCNFYKSLFDKEILLHKSILATNLSIVLSIQPEVAAERQPGDGLSYVIKRATAVQHFISNTTQKIDVIDSGESLDCVTQNIKKLVWLKL